ncbi:sensor domain-containing diguanylate cyclase [Neobacillus sp. LXY-1]|uniref:sensor domain-containing diguanylate cyclase n=1 Tax=Neobacillus sp. LXY-1 TaxID=3379133 RepID=UPI003EE1BA79
MGVTAEKKRILFLVWILLVPIGLWYTYKHYPPQIAGHWLDMAAFLILYAIVASMPMIINNTPIFLMQWATLSAFLSYGLFVEIIFSQVAVIVLLLRLRVQKDQLFRYPLNFTMFFIVSFVSGLVYYWLGGNLAPNMETDIRSFWLAILYAFLTYVLNQVIIWFNLYFVYNSKEPYFGKDFIVETVTTLITFPIGFILYILYNQIGLWALLFVGIPFISLSIIFNLYYSSQQINEYLQKAAEIGHQLAGRLQVKAVSELFMQKLTEMLPVDYAYIFEEEDHQLKLIRRLESGEVLSNRILSIRKNEGIIGRTWASGDATLYHGKMEWRGLTNELMPDDVQSILSVPIVKNRDVTGVLLLASRRKRAFEKFQLTILDILCSYFAVAMENARHYELTKSQSERCALTKLYNFRYFQSLLLREFVKLGQNENQILSLIVIDLDHFKNINDTYGHQSGNEILCEVANRISKLVGGRGTVARYGGEEFVVLLPDCSREDSYQMAEHIRQAIANWPFTLTQSIDHQQQQIKITASIGVATAPDDAADAQALIRHADRALYVGAKRAGRNRVAEYSTC